MQKPERFDYPKWYSLVVQMFNSRRYGYNTSFACWTWLITFSMVIHLVTVILNSWRFDQLEKRLEIIESCVFPHGCPVQYKLELPR